MRIGVDFDNTIVCYHEVFHQVALEQGLIAADFPQNKEKIRDYLRNIGQENRWTEMQGYVYGDRMSAAKPFPGVAAFFKTALEKKIPLYIISHKTRHPYAGPPYDLHQAALALLEQHGFFGLDRKNAFFLETKQAKCEKVAEQSCTHFIDDLPELLLDPTFPKQVEKLWFSPEKIGHPNLKNFQSWSGIQQYFFGLLPA